MKTSIFVVSHKPYKEVGSKLYNTIQVGKSNTGLDFSLITDDTGENIAEKNANYCELTAFYWLWKNIHDVDYIGICHYRRYFTNNYYFNSACFFVNERQIEKVMKNYDVILPKQTKLSMTVREYYSYCDGLDKDLETTGNVISKKYPKYSKEYDTVMKANHASYCNMMITSKELFDEYCTWLFDILFEVEKETTMEGYTKAQRRVFGYISEILLNVWVLHNKLKVKYMDIINTETSIKYRITHRN